MNKTKNLNLQEKKILETIIHQEINTAKTKLKTIYKSKTDDFTKKLTKTKEISLLQKTWENASKTQQKITKKLAIFGLCILATNCPHKHSKLAPKMTNFSGPSEIKGHIQLHAKEKTINDALTELKNIYTLKIFFKEDDTKEIFENLTKELKKLLK